MEFPQILRMLREKQGYSQKQLADVLHVSKNSVSHYELGVCMPSIEVIVSIAEVFDVSLDYLLGRSNANLSKRLLEKTIAKNITAGDMLETILRLDKERRSDFLRLLYYIEKDNNSHR